MSGRVAVIVWLLVIAGAILLAVGIASHERIADTPTPAPAPATVCPPGAFLQGGVLVIDNDELLLVIGADGERAIMAGPLTIQPMPVDAAPWGDE